MRAYIEPYLRDVMRNVGVMSHFCVNEYGVSAERYSSLFARSEVARQISQGNPRYLSGLSGREMADMLMENEAESVRREGMTSCYRVSPEYWAGWALAYCHWTFGKSFEEMYAAGQTYERVLSMYHPMHEADVSKVAEALQMKN